MHIDLIAARDAAVAQHDRIVSQYAHRHDAAFASALEPVIAELERIISAASAAKSDPVELSRTLRWLGDAYFDHGRFAGRSSWDAAANAYSRAEQLLQDGAAPVEQAKLDFNFGNTLAQLSDGTDVKLLEAADIRCPSGTTAVPPRDAVQPGVVAGCKRPRRRDLRAPRMGLHPR